MKRKTALAMNKLERRIAELEKENERLRKELERCSEDLVAASNSRGLPLRYRGVKTDAKPLEQA